jgi:HK97 family phage prohead protease
MTKTLERRTWTQPVEVRAEGADTVIGGYAAVFNRYSQNLGGFVEQIDPGAFTRDLTADADIVCLFNHKDGDILGRSGVNLDLTIDDTGLLYSCRIFADDVLAQSVASKVRNQIVTRSSFGFYCLEDSWGTTDQGYPLRTVLRAALVDVSPVTRPAYTDATVGLRSLAEVRGLDPAAVMAAAERNALAEFLDEDLRNEPEAPGDPGPEARTEADFVPLLTSVR